MTPESREICTLDCGRSSAIGLEWPGGDLIRDGGGGVVVVEIAYRLGLFVDQEFALKWVQKHVSVILIGRCLPSNRQISSFGGDFKKVTIWGESAGAGSVLQRMIAHGGSTQLPLFQAAMTSSTFLPSRYHHGDAVPEQLYYDVVEQVGCSNATNTFACLVSTDASVLEAANLAICQNSFYGTFAFVPVVDEEFIVERPTETIARGRLNGDMLLSVINSFEGRIFVNSNFTSNTTLEEYIGQLFPAFEDKQVKATAEQYTGVGLDNLFNQSVAILGESIFICPTYVCLAQWVPRTVVQELAVPPANHGSDIGYYFPSNRAPPISNVQLSASFAGSFLGIAKSHSPNRNPLSSESLTPLWAPFRAGNNEMLFNITEGGDAEVRAFETDKALLRRCEFWWSVADYTHQ